MNKDYDEEIFEEAEAKAEATPENGKNEKFLRLCFAGIIVAVVIIAILASVIITMSRSGKEEETTVPVDETTTMPVEITTSPAEKYAPGQYTVNVGGSGKLNLRKEPSKDGEQILAIDNATLLTITEIRYDAEAEADYKYWGRTVYKGWDAWVSMKYLANAYSESVVTPGEATTAPVEGTTLAEVSTTLPELTTAPAVPENTTAAAVPEATTAASTEPTSSGPSSAFATGTYTVTAEPHLNMREDHNVSSLSIAQVPFGAEITIVDVYHDADATNAYAKYWGKTTYGGITGWVAMGYLE